MCGAVVAASVLQGVLGGVDQRRIAFLEVSIERRVHAAEERHGDLGSAELAILDALDVGGHPAAADEGLVRFGLILGGTLQRGIIQPDVRDMQAEEDAVGAGLPGEAEVERLTIERLLAFGDEVGDRQGFAATPDAGGGVEGQFLFGGLTIAALLGLERGDDGRGRLLEVEAFEFPGQAHALAVAGLVLEQEHVVLGGEDADAAVMVGVAILVVDRQHGHRGKLRVRRQIGGDVQDGAERDIAEFGGCAMVTHHPVGEQGEGMRVVTTEDADAEHADAAASVDVVYEHELATIGVRF